MSLTIHSCPKGCTLETSATIAASIERVFAFFADAGNLETITPSQLRFRVLTPLPIEMALGVLIDYQLRLHGIPMRWQSEITAWEPPCRFVDEQRRGPYRHWIHEHCFEKLDGKTLVSDRVDYAVPGGRIVHDLIVRRDLRRIFAFREQKLQQLFGM